MTGRSIARCLQLLVAFTTFATSVGAQAPSTVQFVVISDLHYGIARAHFRGESGVDAEIVNDALARQLRTLPATILPDDDGVGAGDSVGGVDFIAVTGDIANRVERGVQSAASSWEQFARQFLEPTILTTQTRKRAPVFAIAGNHDASNAIGFPGPVPLTHDASSMTALFNRAHLSATPRTVNTFQYTRDRVRYSRNVGGVHMVFLQLWPDSVQRVWLAHDLSTVPKRTPVILFAHDPPVSEVKHFLHPSGHVDFNAQDAFQNLLTERYASGDGTTTREQRGFVSFLHAHPNVRAYVHGHDNFSEFYDYVGPDATLHLAMFRVDSPMKGKLSATDPTKLSFLVVRIDSRTMRMTARECLWNVRDNQDGGALGWGASRTISLR